MPEDFDNNFNRLRGLADGWVEQAAGSVGGGAKLGEAIYHSLFPGGKRIRPVLVCAVSEALDVPLSMVRSLAVAVEFIHTSSLIHDDLPALDNDDERRGRASCHKQFGEDLAVLAGDLLLAAAFRVVSEAEEISAEVKTAWCKRLSVAIADLCEGQVMDLRETEENVSPLLRRTKNRRRDLLKTGALFQAAIVSPLECVGRELREHTQAALHEFANSIGQLFQVTDDILDLPAASTSELRGPLEQESQQLYERAIQNIACFKTTNRDGFLRQLCEVVLRRKN